MNVQRKKIIMAEINYWKQNKLLPEHYCDFLITLYTQGDHEQEISATEAILSKKKKKVKLRAVFIQSLYILIAFAILGISLKLWTLFFEGQTILLVGMLIVNCLLWLLAGRLLKLLYFTISGVAGLVMIVIFIMMNVN
ncbi:hypothetical protein MHZ92_13270 [Sporosarcina sp. ACRSL]|uniref:hypothetical protein n=1 Tax=Sporosarcina sp. ACRSL TaxID=2918215 RepID=UPI001EF6B6BB|nr:hypothetical protein [Sporosarcina sp. ACRSL]MCG7345110.1 hypothetical protein [Sporosarcina sp. ACRSL]